MKRFLKQVILFILCISLMLQALFVMPVIASEQNKEITILFTHDMHDNLLPLKTLEDGEVISIGGYTRLMTAIQEQKIIDPQAILVDGGDYSMGTPFQTIYQSDAPELRVMGAMGYDVITFGNHEYDYRPEGLFGSLRAAMDSKDKLPQIVQSNVTFPVDKSGNMTETLKELKNAMEDYEVKDYTILERNGYRIGIFGVMGEESISTAPMAEVTFTNAIKEAKRVVKHLKEEEKVDLILCLSHSGTDEDKSASEDEILAKEVPDIDVIISGHTHTQLDEPIMVKNTVIGSCGDYGKYLGVIKLTPSQKRWELTDYELVKIDDTFTEDTGIQNMVTGFKNIVQEKYFNKFNLDYDEVIAASNMQFQTPEEIYDIHDEATIGNLISDSYIYAVKQAEGEQYEPITAAIVPCGTIRGTIFQGEITAADAFSISSLGIGADKMPGYPLISAYLTGKELKTACEVDASIAPLMGDAQLYMSGIRYTFNPNRLIFNKVMETALINADQSIEEIEDDKLYRVVCGLYSAQMLSIVGDKSFGLMSIVPKNKDGEAIIDFEDYIIHENVNGTQRELKEWYAVVRYLESFEKLNGIPKISDEYQKPEGRKIVDNSKNIFVLLSNPNKISLTVYIAVPLILLLFTIVIIGVIKARKRRKAKKVDMQENSKAKKQKPRKLKD